MLKNIFPVKMSMDCIRVWKFVPIDWAAALEK